MMLFVLTLIVSGEYLLLDELVKPQLVFFASPEFSEKEKVLYKKRCYFQIRPSPNTR